MTTTPFARTLLLVAASWACACGTPQASTAQDPVTDPPQAVEDTASGGSETRLAPAEMRDGNNNGVPDMEDILTGTSLDLNANAIPDEIEK